MLFSIAYIANWFALEFLFFIYFFIFYLNQRWLCISLLCLVYKKKVILAVVIGWRTSSFGSLPLIIRNLMDFYPGFCNTRVLFDYFFKLYVFVYYYFIPKLHFIYVCLILINRCAYLFFLLITIFAR